MWDQVPSRRGLFALTILLHCDTRPSVKEHEGGVAFYCWPWLLQSFLHHKVVGVMLFYFLNNTILLGTLHMILLQNEHSLKSPFRNIVYRLWVLWVHKWLTRNRELLGFNPVKPCYCHFRIWRNTHITVTFRTLIEDWA